MHQILVSHNLKAIFRYWTKKTPLKLEMWLNVGDYVRGSLQSALAFVATHCRLDWPENQQVGPSQANPITLKSPGVKKKGSNQHVRT
jgi:hypothetical protein